MTIPEKLTPLEHVLKVLEAGKREKIYMTVETRAKVYELIYKMVRVVNTTYSITDQADRMIQAFEEYAHTQKNMRTFHIDQCSECGGSHGNTLTILYKGPGNIRYWFICPVLLQSAHYFPPEDDD